MKEAKKLVPQLRFPEFRNMADWQDRRIGEFLTESRLPGSKGNVAKKLTVKLWGNGVFGKNESIQGSINTQYFRRKAGQFIYSKLDFLNQAFGVIPPDLDGFESTVDLPCFDVADELNPVFLLEYVKRKDFYERLGETADGSRKARRIHAETFQSFSLARPTPAEQQKIAECLSSLDELIAAQARKVDALKTHKKGLMQQLFPREGETQPWLRFPEFRDAGEWGTAVLGALSEVVRGGSPRPIDGFLTTAADGLHWLKIGDVDKDAKYVTKTAEKVRTEALNKTRVVNPGDLILSNSMSFGRPYILQIKTCIHDGWIAVTHITKRVERDFLYYLISSSKSQSYFVNNAAGSGVQNLNADIIKALPVCYPASSEQQRIASCLSSLDDLITAAIQELATLKTHKKGLMQQLFPSAAELAA